MGEQRKNLQDIYDAGSSRLEKLDQSQRQALQQSKTQGLENISQIESSMSDQMEVSQADLESEIRAYLDKAVEGIDAAVKSEIEENGKFLEESVLRQKLVKAGLKEGEPVITHCQGGGRASVAAFALELLGFPTRNYYLGWSDWGNVDDTPIAASPATSEKTKP